MTHEIGRLFQQSLDIERVLSTILTCITAGNALGFNRAFVFLLDETETRLEGRMALGPSSPEEAGHIWGEISQRELSLDEILESRVAPGVTALQQRTQGLSIELDSPCFPALRRVIERKSAMALKHGELISPDCQSDGARDAHRDCEEARQVAALLSAYEVAVAPLIAKDRLIGVVFADNLYSNAAIEADNVQLLDTLAGQGRPHHRQRADLSGVAKRAARVGFRRAISGSGRNGGARFARNPQSSGDHRRLWQLDPQKAQRTKVR